MTALLIASFVILLSYILYAGKAESLSATLQSKKAVSISVGIGADRFPDDDLPA